MPALPLIVSALVAAVVAPALLRALGESRLALENYRGVTLPFPAGTVWASEWKPARLSPPVRSP